MHYSLPQWLGQSNCTRDALSHEHASALNRDQRAAVKKVVTAQDYALLQGMPGTGKTSTICFVVRLLIARGASVLVSSYTHSAVDNLLLKLRAGGVPCLRVGNAASVHPGIRDCCLDDSQGREETVESYAKKVDEARVVGATCLSMKHAMFSRRVFDYCIVDEAGQITQPVILGTLRCAKVFVLVGDHQQLPPLVASSDAQAAGMSVSLFKRLSEAQPEALQHLRYQYRMCSDIMQLSNTLVYAGQLKCGNSQVAKRTLMLPGFYQLLAPDWVKQALDPAKKVVFIDTDRAVQSQPWVETCSSTTGTSSRRLVNYVECGVVVGCLRGMEAAGAVLSELGVICPYRSQLHLLTTKLGETYPDVEMNTIDKYQGRDKDAIIISFVRSNARGNTGELLKDLRRLNVALSRPKSKLILVGSSGTLRQCSTMVKLMDILTKNGWIQQLPQGAHECYLSQIQSQTQASQAQAAEPHPTASKAILPPALPSQRKGGH
ncbi:unnamed protein product [Chrysoparadoxa australica]